mmetsp:Transcript_42395/g.79518  ORF Transcript_42395/g.79518 Transcript_42395/m.79518 type:complete len:1897 (-) Transcript_42395:76-5766(-)
MMKGAWGQQVPIRPAFGKGNAMGKGGAAANWATKPATPKPTHPNTAIIVYASSGKDEIGIRTLSGEYTEEGTNHGRKIFKKIKTTGVENIDVFMYYWDERDGPAFSGWWFGNSVGGDQVWSRNDQKSLAPPTGGWTIPWDGEVNKELVVMSVSQQQSQEASWNKPQVVQATVQKEPEVPKTWEERVQNASERAAECAVDAEEALEQATAAMEGDLDEDAVREAQSTLFKLTPQLGELQRFLAAEGLAAQKAPPELKAEMMMIGQRVRKLQATVKTEADRLKNAKMIKEKEALEEEKKAELEMREREMEGAHQKQFEEMMPPAMEKVDVAEDEVEKVAIAAAPLEVDDSEEINPIMMQAIKDTEHHVRAAQTAISEAKRFLNGKMSQAQRFVSTVKKSAMEEFKLLQDKLEEQQTKLNPMKTIRKDYEDRLQSKKMMEDLNTKLAGAEIEVEKAAMMTAPLDGDSTEAVKETESSLASAQSSLSQAARLIDSKLKGLEKQKGAVYEDIKVLQERANSAQEKLDEVRKDLKEQQVRVAANQLLKEVSEKVSSAEDELQRMCDAELPFMKGDPKGPELDALIEEAEEIASKVNTAITEAQAFVAKKLVEVARFSEGQSKVVREDLDGLQKRLDECRTRLQQFKVGSADRKRTHLLQEVEEKVTAAEAEVQRMSEATSLIASIGTAVETAPESLKDTMEQANSAERSAEAAIIAARKALLQKTAELKQMAISGSGSGSELGKFQTRVNSMQQEVAKLRNATKDAEERMLVKQMLAEVVMRLEAVEVEVEKVVASALPAKPKEPVSPEEVERALASATAAQTKLTATSKLIDVKLKNASGFHKEELQGLKGRIADAEKKLSGVMKNASAQKEKLQSKEILEHAAQMVEKAEAQLEKGQTAELPFLKGIEVLHTEEATEAIVACAEAAASGQEAISEARAYMDEKMEDVNANFSSASSETCSKAFTEYRKRLDTVATQLATLSRETTERKRKAHMQESGDKIKEVEGAIQNLVAGIAKFSEDKLAEISTEDARSLCEEISKAEQRAQAAVSNSKRFLSERTADIKSYAEGLRAPMIAELSKLQSRLTQSQVELAKLSKQVTEREQSYVAQKLIQDTTDSLDKLHEDIDAAGKVATPLFAGDISELLAGLYVQAVAGALQSHAKSSGATEKELFAKVTSKASASAADFKAFLDKLAELTGNYDVTFSEEQTSIIFKRVATKPGSMTLSDFKALFKECCVCTFSVGLTDKFQGSTDVCTVEAGETVEVMDSKKDADGVQHVHCALARDGTSGWAPMKASDGAMNFKPSLGGSSQLESIFAYITGINSRCIEAAEFIEQKTTEVAGVKVGPLSEVKAKLLQLRMKVSQEQAKSDQLKKRASEAHEKIVNRYKEEVQKTLEIRCKAFAESTMKEARSALEAAEKKATSAMEMAKTSQDKKSMKELEPIRKAYLEAISSLGEAKKVVTKIQEKHAAFRGTRPILLEARVELTKLRSRADTQEKRCTDATKPLRDAYDKHLKEACSKTRSAIRAAARKSGQTGHEVFAKFAGGKAEMTEEQFKSYVAKLPELGLAKDAVSLLFRETKPTSWVDFSKLVQEYTVCDKGVAITNSFDIGSSTTVRKLMERELWEIIEGPKEDPETKLPRVKGRAVRDGATGWVSVKGNQGSQFLKAAPKPFLLCSKEASLQEGFATASPVVRPLKVGEVLEIVEGPREEEVQSELFLRGTASKDDKSGWITLRSADGVVSASKSTNFYICKSLIAMTDVFDLTSCKVLKKIEPGDALQVTGGEKSKEDASIEVTRLKFRSADGKEGWVTLKGNQGTVYMEPSTSHYRVERETALRKGAAHDSATVRVLRVGEAFEAPEPPIEERPPARMGALARAVEDKAQGWIVWNATSAPVKPYTKKA